jgi:GT2 family glycosyltransferase
LLHGALVQHPEAGIVGPAGAQFDFVAGKQIAAISTAGLRQGEVRQCDAVSGFLLAMRRSDFDAIGGFDEAYAPASMEEIDLAVAVREKLGLGCFVVAGVEVAHEYQVSVGRPWRRIDHNGRREFLFAIHRRNRRHFLRKWAGHLG